MIFLARKLQKSILLNINLMGKLLNIVLVRDTYILWYRCSAPSCVTFMSCSLSTSTKDMFQNSINSASSLLCLILVKATGGSECGSITLSNPSPSKAVLSADWNIYMLMLTEILITKLLNWQQAFSCIKFNRHIYVC